jgi:hypothetical protein
MQPAAGTAGHGASKERAQKTLSRCFQKACDQSFAGDWTSVLQSDGHIADTSELATLFEGPCLSSRQT